MRIRPLSRMKSESQKSVSESSEPGAQDDIGLAQELLALRAASGDSRGTSGWLAGTAPLPAVVVRMGAPSASAMARLARAGIKRAAAEDDHRRFAAGQRACAAFR